MPTTEHSIKNKHAGCYRFKRIARCIGKRSRFRPIWNAFINGDFQLIISEEIIHEYEEILNEYSAPGAADLVMGILSESPDVVYKRIFYAWRVIKSDADGNKFFDAAIAGSADYLITNDAHFNEAKDLTFPAMRIINADKFLEIIENLKK
ncbi:PIN domain-containing protein [Pedobacter sp. BS3]|uniref:PIN domain-containing protein n=1 Tax=Pedobacter sp. BS3 TaxID=2567937 RepID=UPI0011EF315B|nr:PIN domain-containing protein [Pedobacter sp. BS3]TZF83018.1 PIN domain-containing protein [Pedobacter sp. BS3]